jgi:hypothetical protein
LFRRNKAGGSRRSATVSSAAAESSDAAVERLVYEEARRALDLQRDSLDALRTRAGTLLAAASLVTTFLGGAALDNGRSAAGWGSVAIGAFIACALASVAVLLPRKFHFAFDPPELVTNYIDVAATPTLATVLRDLALHHDESRRNNDKKMRLGPWAFRLAALALAFEVVAWLLELGGRI